MDHNETITEPIVLGCKVEDEITKFSGIAVARLEQLWGGPQIYVMPTRLGDDGCPQEAVMIPEERCRPVKDRPDYVPRRA